MTGKEIKAIRTRGGYTQEKLARKLGTSVRAVQSWEQDVASPKGSSLILLKMIDDEAKGRKS
jgi:DNA-binding transcriptional regulator YiaG